MTQQDKPNVFRGFEAVPELLRRAGVNTVFGLLGGVNAPWVGAGVKAGTFQFIRTRHEESAVTAAAGYSRSKGALGVCTTTKGPGFTNSVNALIAATRGHAPLLHITGESKVTKAKPYGSSQEVDQESLAAIIGAGYYAVPEPHQLEEQFWAAARSAMHTGRPQILALADRWFDESVTLSEEVTRSIRPDLEPDSDSINAVIDELQSAQRPLILAGWGAVLSDCRDELIELAELSGARLANSLRANCFFSGHPNDLGLCGSWSPVPVRTIINQTDLVLSFGASLSKHTTESNAIFGGAKLVQCEVDDQTRFHASSPELFLLADAKIAAQALLSEWKRRNLAKRPAPDHVPTREEIKTSIHKIDLGHQSVRGLDPRAVYSKLDDVLPKNRLVATDNGRFVATSPSLVKAQDAKSWLIGNAYGSVGLGLGAAIGAAAAYPDRKIVLLSGDGGFAMAAQELDAIRQGQLTNIIIVIMNDQLYGSDLKYLRRFGLPTDVLYQPLPDLGLLAQVYSGTGYLITHIDQLAAIDFSSPGFKILDIRVDPEVNVRDAI